ncbi:nucleoside-diphosphate-sugar epimerase [Salinibacter ruber]|nr:nucleoside-diphosphate-sugar epimerase [Salinibacter ruber]
MAPSYEELSLGDDEIEEFLQDGGVQLIEGDVLDSEGARKAATGIDVIVHLAANTGVAPSVEDPRHDCETNVIGTLNMLEAARHQDVSRFVLASSGAPIGECDPPIHEEMAPDPKSPYGASKLAGEGYCSAYYGSFNVETVALRFGNVYGPLSSHKSSVVAKFIRWARDGKVSEIYGDGHQTCDYIFTEDLVRAIRLAATTSDVRGELFQIATNSETSINELVDALVPMLREAGIQDVEVTNTEPRVGGRAPQLLGHGQGAIHARVGGAGGFDGGASTYGAGSRPKRRGGDGRGRPTMIKGSRPNTLGGASSRTQVTRQMPC